MNKLLGAETHSPEYLLHKYWARKPHNILSYFINKYTDEGDLVIDPFCGSGVCLREAQKLNRNAYGIDVNPIACLISRVLTDSPNYEEVYNEIYKLIEKVEKEINASFSYNNRIIKYCIHRINAKCPKCGKIYEYNENNKNLHCEKCDSIIRFNLEHMYDTNVIGVCFEDDRNIYNDLDVINKQEENSKKHIFKCDEKQYDFNFSVNRRILAFNGMKTSDLFTTRNFSILSYLADEINKINNNKVKDCVLLLLSASSAQCSRLIANRNNLTSGGPAWSIPGFWVPAIHLETNPLIHIKARLKKFEKGLKELSKQKYNSKVVIKNTDSRDELINLSLKKEKAKLFFLDPPYGDSVPYVEFSSFWNSFLKIRPNVNNDISVSDRIQVSDSWTNYDDSLHIIMEQISKILSKNGRLLITFNNNEIKAWKSLISALQTSGFVCEDTMYQLPAVVSSKAQKAKEGSYISDVYSIYKLDNKIKTSKSLNLVTTEIIKCAKYRNGIVNKQFITRVALMSWIKNNIDVSLITELDNIFNTLFEIDKNEFKLKGYSPKSESEFDIEVKRIAKDILDKGPCNWNDLYITIANKLVNYGIPDIYEIKKPLENLVIFSNGRCLSYY